MIRLLAIIISPELASNPIPLSPRFNLIFQNRWETPDPPNIPSIFPRRKYILQYISYIIHL